jgi:hypothetical protein
MIAAIPAADLRIGDYATPDAEPERLARVLAATDLAGTAGTCTHPIRLTGSRTVVDSSTGQILHRRASAPFGGGITVSCRNRRATVCPACSKLYQYDAYNLIAAGLRGGKNTPAQIAEHPKLFVTLTAPSFGPVHLGPDKRGELRPCHPRREGSSCRTWHRPGDPVIGTPIDPESYDYAGHVLFNASAGALWSRFTTAVRRTLAELAGLSRAEFAEAATVAFAKVAEYQARGVVHFHAVIRLDGPDGAPPPPWATDALLQQAVRDAAGSTRLTTPESAAVPSRVLAWGGQVDVRPIGGTDTDGLPDAAVARYVAKYATKSTETAGLELRALICRVCRGSGPANSAPAEHGVPAICRDCLGTGRRADAAADLDGLSPYARALIDTCWRLGGVPELAELRLRRWSHMLGFRGHFATKSRSYSTTFAALRAERADFSAARTLAALGLDGNTVVVINDWRYAGPSGLSDTASPTTAWDTADPAELSGARR